MQVPLVVSSVSTWLEPGYLGDVLKRMSAAFAEAESLKPAILFIDELDGIGTRSRAIVSEISAMGTSSFCVQTGREHVQRLHHHMVAALHNYERKCGM